MTLIVDASLVVAALVDGGPTGRWAEDVLLSDQLASPHLMPIEVTNILRRAVMAGETSADTASLAHHDLQSIEVALFPYAPVASRVWELRGSITSYDAWYVALAEVLGAKLATLDRRLARASGPECEFMLPPK